MYIQKCTIFNIYTSLIIKSSIIIKNIQKKKNNAELKIISHNNLIPKMR